MHAGNGMAEREGGKRKWSGNGFIAAGVLLRIKDNTRAFLVSLISSPSLTFLFFGSLSIVCCLVMFSSCCLLFYLPTSFYPTSVIQCVQGCCVEDWLEEVDW